MAFKPNYNQQRAERTRAKDQKKQKKLQRQQETTAKRKADDGMPETTDQDLGETGQGPSEE